MRAESNTHAEYGVHAKLTYRIYKRFYKSLRVEDFALDYWGGSYLFGKVDRQIAVL